MYLYVMRHAQSANNALAVPSLGNPDRSSDPSLTEKGFAQAEPLGAFAASAFGLGGDAIAKPEHAIARLFSSPMRRCMLTATPVARALKIPIRVRGDIHEHGGCFDGSKDVDGGVVGLTGMTKAQLEAEFPGCVVPDELANGWWSPERGCETVAQALERVKGVADWLWREAKAWKPEDGAIAIVAHGMFIDILCKTLMGVPTRTGKQSSMFCTNNAGVHVFQFHVGEGADAEGGPGEGAGDIAGLLRFNVVEQFQPAEVRSGGSVVGLDECYMHEGNA